MKLLCIVCELWLVEPVVEDGLVTYYCLRCHTTPPFTANFQKLHEVSGMDTGFKARQ